MLQVGTDNILTVGDHVQNVINIHYTYSVHIIILYKIYVNRYTVIPTTYLSEQNKNTRKIIDVKYKINLTIFRKLK